MHTDGDIPNLSRKHLRDLQDYALRHDEALAASADQPLGRPASKSTAPVLLQPYSRRLTALRFPRIHMYKLPMLRPASACKPHAAARPSLHIIPELCFHRAPHFFQIPCVIYEGYASDGRLTRRKPRIIGSSNDAVIRFDWLHKVSKPQHGVKMPCT